MIISSCEKDQNSQIKTGTIIDIEGNVYKTVKINDLWWMAENLKTTKYRNGDPIPNVTDNAQWSNLTTGAYCNYDNNLSNATTYGRIYNWYVINDPRNICPIGWHVSTDAEWTNLITYLGGEGTAGGKLKEAGVVHWNGPNTGATNETGFSALPGGNRRSSRGEFNVIGNLGLWWSSTESDTDKAAWYRYMGYLDSTVCRYPGNHEYGFSVRCVRD